MSIPTSPACSQATLGRVFGSLEGGERASFVPEMWVGFVVLKPAWFEKRGVPCLFELPDNVVDPRFEGTQRAFAKFVVGHVCPSQD